MAWGGSCSSCSAPTPPRRSKAAASAFPDGSGEILLCPRRLAGSHARASSARACVAPLSHPLFHFFAQLLLNFGVLLLLIRGEQRVDLFVTLRHDAPQLSPSLQGSRARV